MAERQQAANDEARGKEEHALAQRQWPALRAWRGLAGGLVGLVLGQAHC
jgi:hypothetical protein